MEWKQYNEGSAHRPPTWRLKGARGFAIVAVAPNMVEADPDWRSKPGSLTWQTSAELFNVNVGWKVDSWHWSVVRSGRVVGAGDAFTLDSAKALAEAAAI